MTVVTSPNITGVYGPSYLTAAQFAALSAGQRQGMAGTTIIDPTTGTVLGVVDGSGNLSNAANGDGNQIVRLSSDLTATQITSAIQEALDGGNKTVTVVGSGTFSLSDRLYIDDNTTLVIEQGCILVAPAALYHPTRMVGLIVNRHLLATRQNVSVTSSGVTATIAWTAHGKSAGDTIFLMGSTTRGYNGVYPVASVVDANTITVTLEAIPAATSAVGVSWLGSVQAAAANKNINVVINGELNGNGANQPAPPSGLTDRYLGGVYLSAVLYSRITGSGLINNFKGYSILVAGASWPRVDSLQLQSTQRDGAHFQGPIRHLRCEGLYGYTHDDFTSLTTGDLESLEITEGEIEDVVIEKIDGQCSATGAIGAQFGKSVWWFSDVVYKDLRSKVASILVHCKQFGTTPAQYSLDQVRYIGLLMAEQLLWENSTQAVATAAMVALGSSCSLQDVVLRKLRMLGNATANYGMAVWLGNSGVTWSMRHLLIDGLYSTSVGTSAALIQGGLGGTTNIESITLRDCSPTVPDNLSFFNLNGMTVEVLNVEGFTGQLGNASNMLRLVAGTVNYVNVKGASPKITGYATGNNWGELVYSAGAVIKSIRFVGCSSNAYRYVQTTTAMDITGGHVITIIGCRRQNGKLWANLNKGVRIVMDANEEIGASGNCLWLRGSTKYTLVEGSIISEATVPILFFDTATLDIFSPNRRVDITAPGTNGVNRAEGATCWNTNAALGTLATAGPVVCLGTAANSWKKVGNYALTY